MTYTASTEVDELVGKLGAIRSLVLAGAIASLRKDVAAAEAAALERAAVLILSLPPAYFQPGNAVYIADAIRDMVAPDAAAALEAVKAWARLEGLREAENIVALNAWKHEGDDAYSQGMDAGARHQSKADRDAIRAAIAGKVPSQTAHFVVQPMTADEARDLVTDLNRATAGKAMVLPATDGDEGEPA